ncbi:sugar isomerase domain-containing protein [Luethyella okanaganae]|uniref:Sugar isomerase domain-containing protein n=1 Tax=Luethyella okanaganae TaxID=69372 RepID=A0ABW1VDY3_9MICO
MTTLTDRYLNETIALIERIRDEETPAVEKAAALIADVLEGGGRLFAFGCSHSSLPVQDIVYRAGGLMLVNPVFAPGTAALDTRPTTLGSAMEQLPGVAGAVLDNSPIRAGDALIVVSVSGRNAVPIEMAELAQERGVKVVVLTSHAYSDAVTSRHPSGRKAKDFANVVLDNKVDKGDAVLDHPAVPQKFTPASGVTSTAILHMLSAAIIEQLADRGVTPPVFLAANVDGGAEWNAALLEQNAARIFYL